MNTVNNSELNGFWETLMSPFNVFSSAVQTQAVVQNTVAPPPPPPVQNMTNVTSLFDPSRIQAEIKPENAAGITFADPVIKSSSSSSIKWPLVIAAGAGAYLLFKSKQPKTISGMINFKSVLKNVGGEATDALLITGGIVASQKFLDFEKIFSKRDPNNKMMAFLVKHQGGVKAVAGLVLASTIKQPMIKAVATGIVIQGVIKELRVLMNKEGKETIPSIGQNLVTQYLPGVAGQMAEQFNFLQADATNGVAGLGFPAYTPEMSIMERPMTAVGCPPSAWGKF